MRLRLYCSAIVVLSLAGCGASQQSLLVPLSYRPTSSFQGRGVAHAVASATFRIGEVKDVRPVDPRMLGENRQETKAIPIAAPLGSVPDMVRTAMFANLMSAGLRLQDDGVLRLDFEVVQFWVEERDLYSGSVRLRVLVSREGGAPSSVIVDGASKRFGRSLSEDNYNETISDALLHASEQLLSLPAFERAVAEALSSTVQP